MPEFKLLVVKKKYQRRLNYTFRALSLFTLSTLLAGSLAAATLPLIPLQAAGQIGNGTCTDADDVAFRNALSQGGSITFNCGGNYTFDISKRGGPLSIIKDTTIDGGGKITFSGGDIAGILEVLGPGVTLTVSNLTFENGYVDSNRSGGAIRNVGGNVKVFNCTFANNKAQAAGAAIGVYPSGTLEINDNSKFLSNEAGTIGAAIYVSNGSLKINKSTFDSNKAPRDGGAAIYSDSDAEINDSDFIKNTSATRGAVILFGGTVSNKLNITKSRFVQNSSAGTSVIEAGDNEVTIKDSTFSDNTTTKTNTTVNSTAAIYAPRLKIDNSKFTNNISEGANGAIVTYNAEILNSTFTGNSSSTGLGGAIFSYGGLTINNSIFTKNSTKQYGGALYVSGTSNITNSTFTDNSVSDNSGGAIYNVGPLNLSGSKFNGNKANQNGGAVLSYSSLTVADSSFSDNSAASLNGSYGGGAIYAVGPAKLDGITLSNNSAARYGGAIFVASGGKLEANYSTFSKNKVNNDGGAISTSGTQLTLNYSTFEGNTAGDDSGAISIGAGTANIQGSAFYDNKAALIVPTDGNGGAISNGANVNTTITSSSFARNTAQNGGAVNNGGTLTLTNVSMSENAAIVSGGAILNVNPGTVKLQNTVVANSTSGGNCAGSIIDDFTNLQFPGKTCGVSIPEADPVLGALADWGGPTLTMAPGFASPLINKGSNATCASADQRGVSRPQGTNCDIGAFEVDVAKKVGKGTPESCTDAAFTEALKGGGFITFDCGPNPYTIDISESAGGSGTKLISVYTYIYGNNLITLSGGGVESILRGYLNPVTIEVSGLTIANGRDPNFGGAIASYKVWVNDCKFLNNYSGNIGSAIGATNVKISNSTFSQNSAASYGTVVAYGDAIVTDTTFSNNASGGIAGVGKGKTISINRGIFYNNTHSESVYGDTIDISYSSFTNNERAVNGGVVNIIGSTFSGNYSDGLQASVISAAGGSIAYSTFLNNISSGNEQYKQPPGTVFNSGAMVINNSTFANNQAVYAGGALYNNGTLTINNSTFFGNYAPNGGNIYNNGGKVTLRNSIVANSQGGNNCSTPVINDGNNLQWPGNSCGNGFIEEAPKLNPLAPNGGPTRTMLPQPDSPVIDKGNNATCRPDDQSYFARPYGSACDIGAAEYRPPSPPGTTYAWGDNTYYGLGYSDTAPYSTVPVSVRTPEGVNFIAISAGSGYNLALDKDGRAYGWGDNSGGEIGNDEGGVNKYASRPVPVVMPEGVIFVKIVAGLNSNSYGLTKEGKLYAWGYNYGGRLGLGDGTDVIQKKPVPVVMPEGVTFTAVSAGSFHTLALSSEGKVYSWGNNTYGVLGRGGTENEVSKPTLVPFPAGVQITAVAAGQNTSYALASNGRAYAWGFGDNGAIGDGNNLRYYTPTKVNLPANVTFTAIAPGTALGSDGQLYTWGGNTYGELGDGTTINQNIPTPVKLNLRPGVSIKSFAYGTNRRLVLTSDDKIYAWGSNRYGQLGSGDTFDQLTPIEVLLPAGVKPIAISAGYYHNLLLDGFEDTTNIAWPAAQTLNMVKQMDGSYKASEAQYLLQPDGSKWFIIPDTLPGSRISISLTGEGGETLLPADYGLAVHSDIAKTYAELEKGPPEIEMLNSKYAPEKYAPEKYAPEKYAPEKYAPEKYAPEKYAPEKYAPEKYADLTKYNNAGFYEGAVVRSLTAISDRDGRLPEKVEFNTWGRSGDFYIRVMSQNGETSNTARFQLTVNVTNEVCRNLSPIEGDKVGPSGQAGRYKTLIVTDSSRLKNADKQSLSDSQKAALFQKLQRLADQTNGVIIDLSEINSRYKRVQSARNNAEANKDCPYAKNFVADEIKAVLDSYRVAPGQSESLQYLVLVGPDDVIPFIRYPDRTTLGNENEYSPPVVNTGSAQAALRNSLILGQDGYGSAVSIFQSDYNFPVPGLAVGRLVETSDEIETMLDAYFKTGGVIEPQSGMVSGYDFMAPSAALVRDELKQGISPANCEANNSCVKINDTLLLDQTVPPDKSWDDAAMRREWLDNRQDISYIAGHFSSSGSLAADYKTRVTAAEFASSPQENHYNTIVFSLGCHSGYNVDWADNLEGATEQPDWAQAFARQGVTSVIGTGYQYGDSEVVAYSARLYQEFSTQLHTGTGNGKINVPIGIALLNAKKRYLAATPTLVGIHEKTLLIATLYGLPMLEVRMTPTPPIDNIAPVTGTAPVTTGPGQTLGLVTGNATLNPQLKQVNKTLTSTEGGAAQSASYFKIPNSNDPNDLKPDNTIYTTRPFEPLRPTGVYSAGLFSTFLRGVILKEADYEDLLDVLPLTSAPATELSQAHLLFNSPVFYPSQPWSVNNFETLAGGNPRLTVELVQFRSNDADSDRGTLRKLKNLNFKFFYSNNTQQAAFVEPPVIGTPQASYNNGKVEFRVKVTGQKEAGVQEVWLTYTGSSQGLYGKWRSIELKASTTDPTSWEGALELDQIAATTLVFMVQAANGVGQVTLATNNGAYYSLNPATPPPTPTKTTRLRFSQLPSGVEYLDRPTIKVVLEDSTGQRLAGQSLTFDLKGQRRQLKTNQQGEAILNDPANQAATNFQLQFRPGDYSLEVIFAGKGDYLPSQNSTNLTIKPRSTTLSLGPVSQAQGGDGIEAKLLARPDNTVNPVQSLPLTRKAIIFVGTRQDGPAPRQYASVDTDYTGLAILRTPPWPAGSYKVCAYFNGSAPLPDDPDKKIYQPLDVLYQSNFTCPDQINVIISSPATLKKEFGTGTIGLNKTTSLTFTVTNPNQGSRLTALSFIDELPAGLVVADKPEISNSCGGMLTASPNGSFVRLQEATLDATKSCTIRVTVKGTTLGTKTNQTEPISVKESDLGQASNIAVLKVILDDNSGVLRLAQLAPTTGPVDIYINRKLMLKNVGFGEVSQYLTLSPGNYAIDVLKAGAKLGSANPLVSEAIDLWPGEAYTYSLHNFHDDASTYSRLNRDELAPPGTDQALIKVLHASPDSEALKVVVKAGPTIAERLDNGESSDYQNLKAGKYTIEVRQADSGKLVYTFNNLVLDPGKLYTLIAEGKVSGKPDFKVILVEDTAY